MTKIIASVSKKVPVPGIEFSNQQFSSGLEVEIPDDATDEVIQQRLRELYTLLSGTVEAEIVAAMEAAREAGFKARFPDPGGNPGDVESSSDGRRRGYGGQQGGRRNYDDERRDDHADSGRQEYRRPDEDRTTYRRDGGQRPGGWQERSGNGGGNGSNGGNRSGTATQAQVKAVFGIAKANGLERRDLMERVEERFGVRRIEDLNVRQASTLIESLKAS